MILYKAAHVEISTRTSKVADYWNYSMDPRPVLFRAITALNLNPTVRQNVKGGSKESSTGLCIGITLGRDRMPICRIPQALVPAMNLIIQDLALHVPGMRYSSIQINVNLMSKPHVDSGNIGTSYTMSLGPVTGGCLWTAGEAPTAIHNTLSKWTLLHGSAPHGTLPFCGPRVSIVVFTHSALGHSQAGLAITTAINHGIPLPPQEVVMEETMRSGNMRVLQPDQIIEPYDSLCRELLHAIPSLDAVGAGRTDLA